MADKTLQGRLAQRLEQLTSAGDSAGVLGQDVRALAEAVTQQAGDDTSRWDTETLSLIANYHWLRYASLPEGEDQAALDTAVGLFSQLYERDPELVPKMVREAIGHGGLLNPDLPYREALDAYHEFVDNRDIAALDRSAEAWRRIASALSPDSPGVAPALSNLAQMLRVRYEVTGEVRDLDEAIKVAEQAVAVTSAGFEYRFALLGSLGAVLRLAVERTRDPAVLDRAMAGMNVQVIASPDGTIIWTSGSLPGSTHDLTAARIWGILRALAQAGVRTLADKGGYQGAEGPVATPYKGRNKPASQKAANRAHARLRGPGERANAQLKSLRIPRKLRCCPHKAGELCKAIAVLQNYELTRG